MTGEDDSIDVIDLTNDEEPNTIDCPICFTSAESSECMTLSCRHTFCKSCLRQTIMYSNDIDTRCPYVSEVGFYDCLAYVRMAEIRTLLSEQQHTQYLKKVLAHAKANLNTVECKEPDCGGWCILEEVRATCFRCPCCDSLNCIGCNAIHPNMSCKEHQAAQNNNADERKSIEKIASMSHSENGMKCPNCKVSFYFYSIKGQLFNNITLFSISGPYPKTKNWLRLGEMRVLYRDLLGNKTATMGSNGTWRHNRRL